MALVVEVQAFSGRPNPRFVLSHDDEAELRQLIARCAPAGDVAARPPRLGQQGLLVYGLTSAGSWQLWFRVADGLATPAVGPGAGRAHPAAAVEAFLLDAAERTQLTPRRAGGSAEDRAPSQREG